MAELAKKQGVRSFVGLQARMSPAFVKVNFGLDPMLLCVVWKFQLTWYVSGERIVQSGILGRITSTTVLGSDSHLKNFPEKARYINDPASGTSTYFPSISLLSVDHIVLLSP